MEEHTTSRDRAPSGPGRGDRAVPGWVDPLLVAVFTVVFVVSARALGFADWPLGDGWNRYLGNAIAIAEHRWSEYLPWRGPGHAWACLAVRSVQGGSLVRASQTVALVSVAVLFPATWLLGRSLLGRWPALVGVGLLAAWPDLRLFAWFSSPYALAGATFACGGVLSLAAVRATSWRAGLLVVLAGLVLGYATTVDPRVATMVAPWCGALALAALELGLGAAGVAGGVLVVAGVVGVGLYEQLPVDLYSLSRQAALQHDHVAPLVRECVPRGRDELVLSDVFGPCGVALLRLNAANAAAAVPGSPWPFLVLAAVGAWPSGRARLWRRAALVLPLLAFTPALLATAVQHRYLVPYAPLAALLVAAGAVRAVHAATSLARRVGPLATFVPEFVLATLVAALVARWQLAGPSLLTRTIETPRGAGATQSLATRGFVVLAADTIRARATSGDSIVDCARGNLAERLYPIPVVDMRGQVQACRQALSSPAPGGWLFTRVAPVPPGWTVVLGGEPPGAPALLRAEEAGGVP